MTDLTTIRQRLNQELDQLSSGHAGATLGDVRVDLLEETCVVALVAVDSIGCAFEQLSVETPRLNQASADQLRALTDALAQRLTYLLEPVRIMEVDTQLPAVQMRSDPPEVEDHERRYYELTAHRSGIQVRRYRKTSGEPRQVIPAQVTREVLARLISDMLATILSSDT